MTFDSQQQKDDVLKYVTDEKLREEIINAKIVEPWVPEHRPSFVTAVTNTVRVEA